MFFHYSTVKFTDRVNIKTLFCHKNVVLPFFEILHEKNANAYFSRG